MSFETRTEPYNAGIAFLRSGLVRFLIVLTALPAGFLMASSLEPCGWRLLLLAMGPAIVAMAAPATTARIMRFDGLGFAAFLILGAVFVYFAGPMMHQCQAGF